MAKKEQKSNCTEQFMKLLVPNQAKVMVYILSMVPKKQDAEDVLQETLTEMWNQFDRFTPGTNFVAWAITIARYKVYNYRKKQKKPYFLMDDHLIEMLQKGAVEKMSHLDDKISALRSCAEKLTSKEADFLKMRYEDGYTFQQIGKQMRLSHQAIMKAMSRIHARLLRCIRMTLVSWGKL